MRDTIRNKIKLFFAFLIILFLLPYIISVFINGKNAVQGADSDNASVYLAGILAGETDGGYEIEALRHRRLFYVQSCTEQRKKSKLFWINV